MRRTYLNPQEKQSIELELCIRFLYLLGLSFTKNEGHLSNPEAKDPECDALLSWVGSLDINSIDMDGYRI